MQKGPFTNRGTIPYQRSVWLPELDTRRTSRNAAKCQGWLPELDASRISGNAARCKGRRTGLDSSRKCTRQVAWASTYFYKTTCDRQPVFIIGTKPPQLARLANVTRRHGQNYDNFLRRTNPILEARRYAECLTRESVTTKAQVAEIFGVSRPRVTQYMNLLKLPQVIQDFLLAHGDDPVVRNYFRERRLRPLTYLKDPDDIVCRFEEMVGNARRTPGVWVRGVADGGDSGVEA